MSINLSIKKHTKLLYYIICFSLIFMPINSYRISYAETDTQAPTVPTNLISTLQTTTGVALSWNASTDNIGVTAYDIYASGYQAQGNNLVNNSGFESDLTGWEKDTSSGNNGTLSIDTSEKYSGANSAKVVVTQLSSNPEDWMVQLMQSGIQVTANKLYIVKFKAKSNIAGDIRVSIERNISPYDELGNWDNDTVSIDTQWASYTRIFTASKTEFTNSKLTLCLGGVFRTVWIDDVEIYEVVPVSNSLAGTTTGTSITITGLTQGSLYDFIVKARDDANNISEPSNILKVSTDAITNNPGNTDTQVPTAPTGLASTSQTETTVGLSWNTSTDNVGVTGYDIYKNGYQAQGNNLINNGGFESDLIGWEKDTSSGNTGTLNIDTTEKYSGANSAKVIVTQLSSSPEDWMLQLLQSGIQITADKLYIVKFKAKSNITGDIRVSIERNISPYDELGNWDNDTVSIGTQWNSYSRIFTASKTELINSKLALCVGGVLRTIWIDDVEIYEVVSICDSLAGTTTGTSITITGLTQGSLYDFTVKARDAANNISGPSNTLKVSMDAIASNPGNTDTQAPTAPTNLTCTTKTSISVTLSWNASIDNIGVTGYDTYNGTSLVGSTTSTSITITGLIPNTAYNFTARARDAAGNISVSSNEVNVITSISTDTQAPTVPGNLTCTTKTSISVTLSWDASTDNIGIAGYGAYNGTSLAGSTTITSITVNGLMPNTTYGFSVKARDEAGNISTASAIVSVTTLDEEYNITLQCQNENSYTIIISAANILNFSGKTLSIQYNPTHLELEDICASTYDNSNNYTVGPIPNSDLTLLESTTTGSIKITINKSIPGDMSWSGIINSIKFRSKIDGTATIYYSLQ